jgi:hypothetical protein
MDEICPKCKGYLKIVLSDATYHIYQLDKAFLERGLPLFLWCECPLEEKEEENDEEDFE